jgi:hypothetical protein
MTEQWEIEKFLQEHGFAPPMSTYAGWMPLSNTPLSWRYIQPPTEAELAAELLEMAEFRALQLGSWLGTTEGEVITKAVESVMPPYLQADIALLVAGLRLAAQLQQQKGQRVAGGVALVAVAMFGFFIWAGRRSA